MAMRQVLGAGAAPLHGMVAGASRDGGRSGTSSEALAGEQDFGRQQGVHGLILVGEQGFTVRSSSDPAVTRLFTVGPSPDPAVIGVFTAGCS